MSSDRIGQVSRPDEAEGSDVASYARLSSLRVLTIFLVAPTAARNPLLFRAHTPDVNVRTTKILSQPRLQGACQLPSYNK